MDMLRWVFDGAGLTALIAVIVMGYQHKLLWGDYKIRHRINGDTPLKGVEHE